MPRRPLAASGPSGVVRIALADFRWPLDPALADGRDETTLARALYATPLRTDPATGAVVPGLCSAWSASADFRRWRFTCRSAPSIAAALARVQRLPDAPDRWLFAGARISAPAANTLVVGLPFGWRRFPYALTVVGAAPRFVKGPFALVRGSKRVVVLRSDDLTLEFHRLGAREAVQAFRRRELDEAPVPAGDIVATRESALGPALRARTLLALDTVTFSSPIAAEVRRVYRDTANRGDYEQLVPELTGAGAYGFLGGEKARPSRYRRALAAIPRLPKVRVGLGVPVDPALRTGGRLLYAQWRDVGLGPQLVADTSPTADAVLRRVAAAYPQDEAILGELVLRDRLGSRGLLERALGATRQGVDLRRVDRALWDAARAIPVSWVVDARLVSPRLDGWREDLLGNVDYAKVRSRASSRRP